MIRIIAKGPVDEVKNLARKHGIKRLRISKKVTSCNEVIASCPYNRENYDAAMSWFADPDTGYQAPFSPGACLYYYAE